MTRGVLYWNSGTKLLTRLHVSLGSIREIYDGPVTVVLNSNVPDRYAEIVEEGGFNVKRIDAPEGHKQALLIKTCLNKYSPYDTTVFIDCDTLVIRPFDELFEWAEEHKFVVTAFSTWNVRRGAIARRVKAWLDHEVITEEEYKEARDYPAGINVGVMAFQNDASIYEDWYPLAERGIDVFIPDEVSCQILLPKHKHYLAPQHFNNTCRYSPVDEDTRIIHYHGRKHARLERTQRKDEIGTARFWIAKYKQLMEKDWCNIQEVAATWRDRTLRDLDKIDKDGNLVNAEAKEEIKKVELKYPFEPSELAPSQKEMAWLYEFLGGLNDQINSVLEFGCGVTTYVINEAVEPEYYMAVEEFEKCINDVNTHVPNVKTTQSWKDFEGRKFDLVFVDSSAGCGKKKGLFRDKAVMAAEPCMTDETIVILHDWKRRSGKAPRAYLESNGWELVASFDGRTGLGAYRRKSDDATRAAIAAPTSTQSNIKIIEKEVAIDIEDDGIPRDDYSKLTVVTACDDNHLPMLKCSLPTWVKIKGLTCPIIIFLNGVDLKDPKLDELKAYDNVRIVPWDLKTVETQRERMLAAFIIGAAKEIETEFWLKLDSDTAAVDPKPWFKDVYYDYDMIGHRWGYTKPGTMVPKVDYWMDGLSQIGAIKGFKGIMKKYKIEGSLDEAKSCKHMAKRVMSCVRIMKTQVTRDIAAHVHADRLVIPSEDTLVWRWCERLGLNWGRHNFKKEGWIHTKKGLKEQTDEALAQYGDKPRPVAIKAEKKITVRTEAPISVPKGPKGPAPVEPKTDTQGLEDLIAALEKGNDPDAPEKIAALKQAIELMKGQAQPAPAPAPETNGGYTEEEIEETKELCESVIGDRPFRKWSITIEEWLFINKYVKDKQPKNIIEIGSYMYTSSLAFIKAMPGDAHLTSIDFSHEHNKIELEESVEKRWIKITSDSRDALPRLRAKSYDLIFIDGTHTADAVEDDLKNALELLTPDGSILFHDINNAKVREGMSRVFDESAFRWINRDESSNKKGIAVYDPATSSPS
jgi:predicted O-methyltransferase YrrM